tara:strand:+ start:749 stop:1711 length:963 start_codon:yes stop_codon:yes gene_type:complete
VIKTISIIGFGNIGKRHFESINKINYSLNIYLIDPIIEKNYLYVEKIKNKKHKIHYFINLDKVNRKFDLAIISTHSSERYKIINFLLNENLTSKIFLEKVAFNSISKYQNIISKLKLKKIKCFINYPRNYVKTYKKIKNKLNSSLPIKMSVKGSNWGMTSNSFHFINLFQYINNNHKILIATGKFGRPYKSSRENYYDFNGELTIETSNNDKLFLEQNFKKNTDVKISIENSKFKIKISEKNNTIYIFDKDNKKAILNTKEDILPYQSKLTKNIIYELNKKKQNENINIFNIYNNDIILLKLFQKKFDVYKNFKDKCPIT